MSASGAKNATLAYDPLGRLWQVTGAGGTTKFFHDGDRLTAESDGSNNWLRSYVHGPKTGEVLTWHDATADRRFLKADHQGSIVAVVNSAGATVAVNAYDPWGIPNAGNLGRFGYTGQAWIPELGMWYYKARFYSATLGRFMQTDPIGFEDQVNLYAYVGNDPINNRDPTGTTCDSNSSPEGKIVYSNCKIRPPLSPPSPWQRPRRPSLPKRMAVRPSWKKSDL